MARYEVHRSDGNAKEIIDAMRKMGASVEIIDRPVDILVGYRGVTAIAEIKTPRGKLQASQKAFLDGWRGLSRVIRDVDDAEDLLYYMQGVADAVIDSSSDPF
jgi:hypothetical protein